MAVEKAGKGESDTSEFVTGPFSVTFNVRIRIRLPYPPCDMVVAGVGATAGTELFAKSGLAVENGIMVNEYLESNQVCIFAAGDVANYVDKMSDKRRRVEHCDNAVFQGLHWARIICGERRPFLHVLYFFSDVFDLFYKGRSQEKTHLPRLEFFLLRSPCD
jgi:3-phenylpropionate/trans-cinnamate dioxygenase ferredoxin reductase subunit